MSTRGAFWIAYGLVVVLVVVWVITSIASAGPVAAPCRTAAYRTRVVNVLGTSESLLAATDGAWRALRTGHAKAARATLRSIHDYLPTYWYREGRLVNLTEGCGT